MGIVRVKSFMLKFSQFDQLHDFCMNFYGRVLLLHLALVRDATITSPSSVITYEKKINAIVAALKKYE